MKSKVIAFIVGIAAIIAALVFDQALLNALQQLRKPWPDSIFLPFLWLGEQRFIFYPLVIAIGLAALRKKRLLAFLLAVGLSTALVYLLKFTIARPRPLQSSYSFPSGHAGFVFVLLPFLKGKAALGWLIFALLISFARFWFSLHYLSDLIAGALIGLGLSYYVKKKFNV